MLAAPVFILNPLGRGVNAGHDGLFKQATLFLPKWGID
jgi:hypothetical protein